MKLIKPSILIACAAVLASCGISDRSEDVKTLNKKKKWNEEQTSQAIDIYIEGVNDACSKMEDIILIEQKISLKRLIKRYGDEDVIKERKNEIKEAEKQRDKVVKEVEKKYKKVYGSSSYDDDDYDYSDYAEEAVVDDYDDYDY